eukprot:CAMPEP_0119340886 /NCGR_PEP_ID=MMETSP1333-20130426/101212_1 /TAXON_ID=418940 /ORGANISM="Scyphosphaera apsteinii, Strain RCC1455" /LENGTH=224 /DNA_ID=CAMNT_0007352741 /DNA_START=122 /DNA_END=796 /DNA_ORIENTATION=-
MSGGSPACQDQPGQAADLYDPSNRDAHYGSNLAQYMVDLHDAHGTFDFCGGMMFQLVLSDMLRDHFTNVAKDGQAQQHQQLVVFDAAINRMAKMPGYSKDAHADNTQIFHGREVRKVPDAAGGMGFTIHLSHSDEDPEGWTLQERAAYDGWGHDSGRMWRNGEQLEKEGFQAFRNKFGAQAFTLHHRFFLHLDQQNRLWLSAEDGCEGFPSKHSSIMGPRGPGT